MPDKIIKAVLFDLGETLLTFGKVNKARIYRQGAESTYDFLKKLGQPVGSFTYYYWRNLVLLRIKHWLSFITGRDFDAFALLKKSGAKKGIKLTEQQWQHLVWLWYEPLSKVGQAEPNTKETLTTLTKLGLKLGIVSNTFVNAASLDKHLEQLGLLDFFPVRLYSYKFDFRKPDTRIFTAAADKIGEMFENILFVGDQINKDVKAAMKTGMYAVLKAAYTNAEKKTPNGVLKITQLAELPALIQKINNQTSN
ncbi:MAG: HAD family hydrolase [Phycisphaerae bacterium]|nr:HAD family hydrolase [Phycisphaerae bacterium]